MAGNVYRFDPPPQQAVPHVPLPAAAFTQPPNIGGLRTALLGCILASWPALTDPRPNQFQQVQIASLTLSYPTAPQDFEPTDDLQIRTIYGWWPEDKGPRPAQFQQVAVATLTLPTGNQPPVIGPLSPQELVIQQSWPGIWWPAQFRISPVAELTAPLPFIGPTLQPQSILASWQPSVIIGLELGGLVQPVQGDLPVPVGPMALSDVIGVTQAWQPPWTPWPLVYSRQVFAPIPNPIPLPLPIGPLQPPWAVILAWQPAWGPWPQLRRPITLSPAIIYGNLPPIIGNLRPSPAILATWQPPWGPPPDRESGLAHLEPLPPIPPNPLPIVDDLIRGWL